MNAKAIIIAVMAIVYLCAISVAAGWVGVILVLATAVFVLSARSVLRKPEKVDDAIYKQHADRYRPIPKNDIPEQPQPITDELGAWRNRRQRRLGIIWQIDKEIDDRLDRRNNVIDAMEADPRP